RGDVLLAVGGHFPTGCEVGPKYVKPSALPSPPAIKEPLPSNVTDSSDWKTANPKDQVERGKWWMIFGDAQLNDFEDQLTQANKNLKLAGALFRQPGQPFRLNAPPDLLSI